MACHDVRRLFRWEVEGSDELKEGLVQRLRRATIWSQHLRRYRSVLVKPVTPAQEAKTVVASGAAVLTFTHQRWRAVSCHSNVPSVSTASQSSGGRASASVHPAHKTLVDSFRCVRCNVCSAAAASAGACFVSLSLGGVYQGCSRVDDCGHIRRFRHCLLQVASHVSSRFLELRWQACPQPHSCCCVQLLQ